jgi:hypothetical protein
MTMSDEACLHSYLVEDCLPCHKGYISRQESHINRLRQMLVDAGAADELQKHDAHWFGGNAQPLPSPAVVKSSTQQSVAQVAAASPGVSLQEFVPAPVLSEVVLNDQGFASGFRLFHPPGVECAFDKRTHKCSCGQPEPTDETATEQSQSQS